MKITKDLKNNLLIALAIVLFGYLFLNAAFTVFSLFIFSVNGLIGLFSKFDLIANISWSMPVMLSIFAVIIYFVSRLVFKSKLPTTYKAIYLYLPVALVLALIGISLYRWPIAVFAASIPLVLAILYYFYKTKQPWKYYFSVISISLILLVMMLLGVDI